MDLSETSSNACASFKLFPSHEAKDEVPHDANGVSHAETTGFTPKPFTFNPNAFVFTPKGEMHLELDNQVVAENVIPLTPDTWEGLLEDLTDSSSTRIDTMSMINSENGDKGEYSTENSASEADQGDKVGEKKNAEEKVGTEVQEKHEEKRDENWDGAHQSVNPSPFLNSYLPIWTPSPEEYMQQHYQMEMSLLYNAYRRPRNCPRLDKRHPHQKNLPRTKEGDNIDASSSRSGKKELISPMEKGGKTPKSVISQPSNRLPIISSKKELNPPRALSKVTPAKTDASKIRREQVIQKEGELMQKEKELRRKEAELRKREEELFTCTLFSQDTAHHREKTTAKSEKKEKELRRKEAELRKREEELLTCKKLFSQDTAHHREKTTAQSEKKEKDEKRRQDDSSTCTVTEAKEFKAAQEINLDTPVVQSVSMVHEFPPFPGSSGVKKSEKNIHTIPLGYSWAEMAKLLHEPLSPEKSVLSSSPSMTVSITTTPPPMDEGTVTEDVSQRPIGETSIEEDLKPIVTSAMSNSGEKMSTGDVWHGEDEISCPKQAIKTEDRSCNSWDRILQCIETAGDDEVEDMTSMICGGTGATPMTPVTSSAPSSIATTTTTTASDRTEEKSEEESSVAAFLGLCVAKFLTSKQSVRRADGSLFTMEEMVERITCETSNKKDSEKHEEASLEIKDHNKGIMSDEFVDDDSPDARIESQAQEEGTMRSTEDTPVHIRTSSEQSMVKDKALVEMKNHEKGTMNEVSDDDVCKEDALEYRAKDGTMESMDDPPNHRCIESSVQSISVKDKTPHFFNRGIDIDRDAFAPDFSPNPSTHDDTRFLAPIPSRPMDTSRTSSNVGCYGSYSRAFLLSLQPQLECSFPTPHFPDMGAFSLVPRKKESSSSKKYGRATGHSTTTPINKEESLVKSHWSRKKDFDSVCEDAVEETLQQQQQQQQQLTLVPSATSWAASRQRITANKNISNEDTLFFRKVKSILNKMTVEKFDTLSAQLLDLGFEKPKQIKILMDELWAKSTTQHHNISMYCNLCVLLNKHLKKQEGEHKSREENEFSFRRLLLDQCQDSFSEYMKPAEIATNVQNKEDVEEQLIIRKTKMLGNVKFIGQLCIICVHKLISRKPMLFCIQELIDCGSDDALESLCVFLREVGPHFDTEYSSSRPSELTSRDRKKIETAKADFDFLFEHLEAIVDGETSTTDTTTLPVSSRIKFLLKNVIEGRKRHWKGKVLKNEPDGPVTLAEVKGKWAQDHRIRVCGGEGEKTNAGTTMTQEREKEVVDTHGWTTKVKPSRKISGSQRR